MAIELLGTGLIYRNPKPHLRAIHAMHPSLAKLGSGRLLAAFDLGQGPESFDYAPFLSRSEDQGRTWTEPQRLFDEPRPRPCVHLARIRHVGGGRIAALAARLFRDHDDEGLVNRQTFGYVPMDLLLLQSADGGRSWSRPAAINPPIVGPSFEICHGIVELADGRWLAPMSTWKGWDGDAPSGMKAIALVSRDRGETWPEYITVMDDYANGYIHFEQSLVQLPDQRLLAIAWAFHQESGRSDPNPYALSEDGLKFGPRMSTGLNGETAKIVCLRDGRILCLYRRTDRPGLWANLSKIEGNRWINLDEKVVWQGAASKVGGLGPTGEELSNLKFGSPSLVLQDNGDVFAAFWCREDCITNIRWLHLRA